ncbi:MAG: 50S ribosomal protein L16 [Bacteroidetes bacterium]|nr:50S ribosomal protein L16 [Bacteroidota bacterium]
MKRHKGRITYVPYRPKIEKVEGQKKMLLVSKEPGRITETQMKAVIMILKRKLGKGNKIAVRVFPHLAVTAKPLEVRMGKGKGSIDHRISRIRANSIIVEIHTREGEISEKSVRAAGSKLPVRYGIINL